MNIKLKKIFSKRYIFYFILPSLFLIFLFFILPNVYNFVYSFTDWSAYKSGVSFIGIENFYKLINQGNIWKDLLTTIEYAILVTVFMNLISLILAFALEKVSITNGILRTIFFIPVLISPLAAGYIFKAFLKKDGVMSQFLSVITQKNIQIDLLGNLKLALFLVAIVHCWKFMGIPLIVYIAGLNTIPNDLIEAARIEGANAWQMIKKIKIPLLGPAFTFNVSLSLIGALSIFDLVLAMTRGGPGRATEVLNIYILTSFSTGRLGFTTTISLVLSLSIILLGVPLILFLRRREVEL